MADKNLQFLDMPRADPAKAPLRRALRISARSMRPSMPRARAQQAGRCLACGNPVLRVEMPGPQLHPQLAEAHRGGQPVRGGGAFPQDQLAAGSLRPHLPAGPPVRGRLHAQRRPGRRHIGSIEKYITDEALKAGWKPDMSNVQPTGKRVGDHRRGSCGPGLRGHPGAQRRAAGGVRPLRSASAACSPSASRPSSSRRKWWKSAARSWRAWASSFA